MRCSFLTLSPSFVGMNSARGPRCERSGSLTLAVKKVVRTIAGDLSWSIIGVLPAGLAAVLPMALS